jgi:hypothetical protein
MQSLQAITLVVGVVCCLEYLCCDDSLSCRICDANYTCLCILEILKLSSSCPASFICWDNPLSEINMFICSQKVSLLVSVNCATIVNKWTMWVNFEMDCV